MPDKRLRKSLLKGSAFVVVAELTGGPGYNFGPIEKFLSAFRDIGPGSIPHGFDFVGITVTQNPGGVANIAPTDVLARLSRLHLLGPLDFIPHISCKDHNADGLKSSLVGFRAREVESVLVITGDKPASALGVFELDSAGLLRLIQRMNADSYLQAKPDEFDKVRQLFPGAAVSPFKYAEASQMQQYYKMERKIASGARFLITQVGWDWRKSLELMQYLDENRIDVPVLGNVYLLTSTNPAPRLMHDGKLPGCYVSDSLYARLHGENFDQHLERAAQQVAMYRSIGAAGVDLGGVHDYDTFVKVLTIAAQIGDDWEKNKDSLYWPGEKGFYLYEQSGTKVSLSSPRKKLGQRLFNIAHRAILDPDHAGFKAFRSTMSALGARKGKGVIYRSFYAAERAIKYMAFECQDCGDCFLPENFGYCTIGRCQKGLNNAPCGDSTVDGMCGNDLTKVCVGDLIYEAAAAQAGGREKLRRTINAPRDPALRHTASVLNYLFARDHTKRNPFIVIGEAVNALFPPVRVAMQELHAAGDNAYEVESGALNYLEALIQSQSCEGADYIAVNVDALNRGESGPAAESIVHYVKMVRRLGNGVPVCVDSNNADVLVAGLRAWHDAQSSVAPPLVASVPAFAADGVLKLRNEFDFRVTGRLVVSKEYPSSVDEMFLQAKHFLSKAVDHGFRPQEVFFELPVVPLAQDGPGEAGSPSRTHDTFEAIRKIKNDSKMRRAHCLLRAALAGFRLPRSIGVCRAYVSKATEYGLDAVCDNAVRHYGESPADAKLLELVNAYAIIDGTPGSGASAAALMESFCSGSKKPSKGSESRIEEKTPAKKSPASQVPASS